MAIRNLNDLIRIGVYTQTEGSFFMRKTGDAITDYQFRYSINQIDDIEDLIKKVVGRNIEQKNGRIKFSSRYLYESLLNIGFTHFKSNDWNVPNINSWGTEGQKEYLRAIIDSLGNVDIYRSSPYIAISSINEISLKRLNDIFGGKFRIEKRSNDFKTSRITWYGKESIYILNYIDWTLHNHRNKRGAILIKSVRWEDYLL